MKTTITIFLFSITFLTAAIHIASTVLNFDITELYQFKIRHYIFTSFLSIGSFILSLMSMIVFTMHKNIFSNEKYKEYIKKHSEISLKQEDQYSPLINIGRLFLFCVLCCIITSIVQFSIGLINYNIAIAFSLSWPISTLSLILFILFNVWKTFEVWFKILKKENKQTNNN
jgi:hypothetical protein